MRLSGRVQRLVAAVKPAIPDRVWPLLLGARSALTSGPLVAPPGFGRVLVLAAHPDDESIGCAGTIALLASAGAEVTVLFATDGEATRGAASSPETTGARRREEARAACRLLGVTRTVHLALPDGALPAHLPQLASGIESALSSTRAEVLLLPWFLDGHRDHQALDDALESVPLPGGLEVWGYETWTPLPATRIVDVTGVLDQRTAALAAHVTAHRAFDVSGTSLGRSRWRSLHGLMGRGHAEAFLTGRAEDYLLMLRTARAAQAGVHG